MATASSARSAPSPQKPYERARAPAAAGTLESALVPSSRNQLLRSARDTADMPGVGGALRDNAPLSPYERERALAGLSSSAPGGTTTTTLSSNASPRLPPRPSGGGFFDNYSSRYGASSSLYNNRPVGYGSSPYGYGGSSYGNSLYGGGSFLNPYSRDPKYLPMGYGDYGMAPPLSGSFGWVHDFQSLVQTFAQISWLLDANFETLGNAFGSMWRFLNRARYMTTAELTPILQVMLFFSALGVAGAKLTALLRGSSPTPDSADDLTAFRSFSFDDSGRAFMGRSSLSSASPLMRRCRRYVWLLSIVVLLGTMLSVPVLVALLAKVFRSATTATTKNNAFNSNTNTASSSAASSASSSSRRTLHVRALYDFDGETRDDLPFRAGELLEVLEPRGEGWFEGRLPDGRVGLCPITHVSRPLSDDEPPDSRESLRQQLNSRR